MECMFKEDRQGVANNSMIIKKKIWHELTKLLIDLTVQSSTQHLTVSWFALCKRWGKVHRVSFAAAFKSPSDMNHNIQHLRYTPPLVFLHGTFCWCCAYPESKVTPFFRLPCTLHGPRRERVRFYRVLLILCMAESQGSASKRVNARSTAEEQRLLEQARIVCFGKDIVVIYTLFCINFFKKNISSGSWVNN